MDNKVMVNNKRRCWAEISLSQLRNNFTIYKSSLTDSKEIMAVVKADAYGHGDIVVSCELAKQGVAFFAVSNVDEAIRIRMSGIMGQILILGYTPLARIDELITYDITQALLSEEYAEQIVRINPKVKCQFAIDTGMRRIGLNAEHSDCSEIIRKYHKRLNINGIFTHLCVADKTDVASICFTEKQIRLYEKIINEIEDLHLPYCHCLNSAGGILFGSAYSFCVRLGIILYGLKPDYLSILPKGIEPILSWKSVVSMVKKVEEGDTIGYGRSYKATSSMKIATIPVGYADGYSRLLSNKGFVLINGKKAPIVGRVCMDQFMVDVSEISDIRQGTEVVLLGKSGLLSFTADDMAQLIDTIGYEIVCGISKRVERVYIE